MTQAPAPERASRAVDFDALREVLRAGRATDQWLSSWLPDAYAAPEQFQQALYAYASQRPHGLKSSPAGSIDFYHDAIVAHLGCQRRAFVWSERGRVTELSFEALHARAGALASAWLKAGMTPGKSIALVLPVAGDYVCALLAALRLGLVICPLPPFGATFVEHRLKALAPDAIVLEGRPPFLGDAGDALILPLLGAAEGGALPSHAYAADDPVLRLFPAFDAADRAPIELAAGPLHAALLCDATLVFALDGRDTLCAPGFDPLAGQPSLLLSALLAGAAWAELTARDVQERPALLTELGVTLLGVVPGVRDALLSRASWETSSVRAWFRNMTDPLELERWDALGRHSAPAGVAAFNTAMATTAGGALLFGPVLREPLTLQVWPVPSRAWQLGELASGPLKALNEAGTFSPLLAGAELAGVPHLLVARSGAGFLCSGSTDLGPGACVYPVDEVSAVVERHGNVRHATVVVSPGRTLNTANVTLVVFVDDTQGLEPSPVTAAALSALIGREMGERFLPNRLEVFALRPRVTRTGLDRAWCRSQYLSGALTQKARNELFGLLARLGYLLDSRAQIS